MVSGYDRCPPIDSFANVTPAKLNLSDWLDRLERINPDRVDLGLDRVAHVWRQLQALGHQAPWVITVAGTNGKGSSVAMLTTILQQAGLRVGMYSSPHLVRFTERIRIDGVEMAPQPLVHAFEEVERCEGSERLTYFEWATLAAWVAFSAANLDVWVLEVGLGGRLDAVNILDADLALITNIGLDHVAMLGNDRAAIAREKAGILRPGHPAVYGDADPVASMVAWAESQGVPLSVQGRDYRWMASEQGGFELELDGHRQHWPAPGMPGRHQLANAAAVVALLLQARRVPDFPSVDDAAIANGLMATRLAGRCERHDVAGREVVLDVAHNLDGVRSLHDCLAKMLPARQLAVFSALADKDVDEMLRSVSTDFSQWHVGRIDSARAGDPARIVECLERMGPVEVHHETSVTDAYNGALAQSKPGDRIVVFGSFLVVGAVRELILQEGSRFG